jgi:branched-chain amino acid transport system permease protein
MAKKTSRSARNSARAIGNFFRWLPRAVKHFFQDVPPTLKRIKPWAVTFRGTLTILCLLGVFILPLFTSNIYYLGIFDTANIFVIFAASWDLLAGFVGQTSFGHAAFLGIGGYATAAFARYYGQPWWMAMILGAIVAVLIGLLIGIPCLRLRGPYLALGTLAFSLILADVFLTPSLPLGGTGGVSHVLPVSPDPSTEYLIILIVMILSVLTMIAISNSRVGTVFKAIRDDETSAEASGINATKYKLVAFMISSFFAGIAGALFALHNSAVSPSIYAPLYSFYAIIMATLGGIATIFGSLGGAYFFYFLLQFLSGTGSLAYLIFAVILIVVLRFASGGVIRPLIERLRQLWDILLGK